MRRAIPVDATSIDFVYHNIVDGAGPHGQIGFVGAFFNVLGSDFAAIPVHNVASGTTDSFTCPIPTGAVSFSVSATPGPADNSNLAEVTGSTSGTPIGSPPCAGGTSRKDLTTDLVILGGTAIDAIAIALGGSWLELLALLVDAIGVHVLSTATLCAGAPPPMPTITNDDYLSLTGLTGPPNTDQIAKFWTAVQAAVWPYFCQCTPGTGGTPFPDPTPPAIAIATPPTIACDGTDICGFLNQLAQKIDTLSLQVQYTRRDVTLVQRQAVPFGYIASNLHTGLSGSGQFAIADILGLAVQVTTVPGASGQIAGDPIARFGLGWVTTGTADGWRRSTPVRANPQWVEVQPDDTLVGYSFDALVVANIQEFVREP